MSTVTKSWTFTSDAEGLTDVGDSAITFQKDPGDSSVHFAGAASGTQERGRGPTGETWETWGVPAGATVTNIQITAWSYRRWGSTTSGSLALRVVDSGGTTVHSAGELATATLATGQDGSWQAQGAGTSRAVDSGKQASTTEIRLEIQYNCSAPSAGNDIGIDTITIEVTYLTNPPPTYKSVGSAEFQITPGAGNGLTASVPRPDTGGIPASGDTVFHALIVPDAEKANYIPPPDFTQVGSWVVGLADLFGTPAFGIFKRTYDSAPTTSEPWTYDQDATRGACIFPICYSGDCTIQQIQTSSDVSDSGARNGPEIAAATGNLIVAFFGGSAVTNPGVAWGNSFIERFDREFYGINTCGELAGDGTSKTPALTPVDPSQSMWIVLDLGPNTPPSGPPAAGDAGPTLIKLIGNRQTW